MSKHDQSISALNEVAGNIQTIMSEHNNDIVVYTSQQRVQYLNQYVVVFLQNLKYIVKEYKLSNSEMNVLLAILEKMQLGNLVSLSFSGLAKELGMDSSNLSKIKKKFIKCGLMNNIDGCIYMNPHIIAYGSYAETKKNKDNIDILNKAYDQMHDTELTPSIGTKYIREQERHKKQLKKDKKEVEQIIEEIKSDVAG